MAIRSLKLAKLFVGGLLVVSLVIGTMSIPCYADTPEQNTTVAAITETLD